VGRFTDNGRELYGRESSALSSRILNGREFGFRHQA